MDKSLTMEPITEEAAKFREFLQQGLAEMDRLFELMARDQEDIDRFKARSLANLAEIQSLSDRTDVILATLKAA